MIRGSLWLSRSAPFLSSSAGVGTDHKHTAVSSPPESIQRPFGWKVVARMGCLWPSPQNIATHGCFWNLGCRFHRRMVASSDAEAMRLVERGETARSLMPFPCPGRILTGLPVWMSRIFTCLGALPATQRSGSRVVGCLVQTMLLYEAFS